jgi:hypothetical protein
MGAFLKSNISNDRIVVMVVSSWYNPHWWIPHYDGEPLTAWTFPC